MLMRLDIRMKFLVSDDENTLTLDQVYGQDNNTDKKQERKDARDGFIALQLAQCIV